MPLYQFRKKDTDEIFEDFYSISGKEEFLKNNPNIEQVVAAPLIVSGGMQKKPDEGFRDILRSVKKRNPRSNINTF